MRRCFGTVDASCQEESRESKRRMKLFKKSLRDMRRNLARPRHQQANFTNKNRDEEEGMMGEQMENGCKLRFCIGCASACVKRLKGDKKGKK